MSDPLKIELELVRSDEAEDPFGFRFVRQGYVLRYRGGRHQSIEVPWSRDLLADLEALRRPDRDPALVASIGNMLRDLLTAAVWQGIEEDLVEARRSRTRVHITLRLAAAELYALPWELLTLRADGQHLGGLSNVLLRYAWPGTQTSAGPHLGEPGTGRLLFAWSAAGGEVPAAAHRDAILRTQASADGVDVDVVANATFDEIAETLERADKEGRPYTAVHLLCHGGQAGSSFGLCLDSDGGQRPVIVDGVRVQQLLVPHAHALRLVVIAACDGGNAGELGNRVGSVAQRLHRGGIAKVIASRYPLSSRGSTRVTEALYESLFAGDSVETAFIAARREAVREVEQLDWASVQLYARPEDGDVARLFSAAGGSATVVAEPEEVVMVSPPPAAAPPPKSKRGLLALGVVAAVAAAGVLVFRTAMHSPESRPGVAASMTGSVPQPAGGSSGAVAVAGTGTGTVGGSSGEQPDEGTSSGTAGVTEGQGSSDSSAERPDRQPPRRKPPESKTPTRPTARCPSGIAEDLRDRVGKAGQRRASVWVLADGSVQLRSCPDCGDAKAELVAGLRKVNSHIAGNWKGEYPCRTSFDW